MICKVQIYNKPYNKKGLYMKLSDIYDTEYIYWFYMIAKDKIFKSVKGAAKNKGIKLSLKMMEEYNFNDELSMMCNVLEKRNMHIPAKTFGGKNSLYEAIDYVLFKLTYKENQPDVTYRSKTVIEDLAKTIIQQNLSIELSRRFHMMGEFGVMLLSLCTTTNDQGDIIPNKVFTESLVEMIQQIEKQVEKYPPDLMLENFTDALGITIVIHYATGDTIIIGKSAAIYHIAQVGNQYFPVLKITASIDRYAYVFDNKLKCTEHAIEFFKWMKSHKIL